jgi:hypothetical protein
MCNQTDGGSWGEWRLESIDAWQHGIKVMFYERDLVCVMEWERIQSRITVAVMFCLMSEHGSSTRARVSRVLIRVHACFETRFENLGSYSGNLRELSKMPGYINDQSNVIHPQQTYKILTV